MSAEIPKPTPRILDLLPRNDGTGNVSFTIGSETTGKDVLATFEYAQPDLEERARLVRVVMQHGVEKMGLLRSLRLKFDDPVGVVSEQAEIVREIRFGVHANMSDLDAALDRVYGQEAAQHQLEIIFKFLVDRGRFQGLEVIMGQHNEIVTALPESVDLEMQQLTEQFYKGQGL